ncbi:MAG: hypothetical protein RL248_1118 [Pseudomonadota bacterium]
MNEKVFTLPIVEQISPCISQRQLDELPIVVVSHPKFRAAISLQGAHLLTYQPSGEQPIIWLSNNTPFNIGVAIRGGVPICWPWFGSTAKPSHGFARILPWKLSDHDEHENGVILAFTLKDSEVSRKLWPHAFTLIARFKLGDECEIELESHGEYQAKAALHTYVQIGDISQIKVSGLGEKYVDKVLNIADATQQRELMFNGQTDRIYTHPEAYSVIKDAALKRTIEVHHHHQSDVVVWNPGAELSCSMADMPNNGYKTMVCVETARISEPLVATADTAAHLAMSIRCCKNAGHKA